MVRTTLPVYPRSSRYTCTCNANFTQTSDKECVCHSRTNGQTVAVGTCWNSSDVIYSIKNSSSLRLTFSMALAEHAGRPAGRIRKLQLDLLYHEALKLAWGQQRAATGAEVNTIKNHATGVYKRYLNSTEY